jgi:hypothetical protein
MKSVLVAKIAAAAAAALAATGGLAAASALPAPVQSVLSDAVEHVGVDLPSPDDGTGTVTGPSETTTTTTSATEETDPPTPTTVVTTPDEDDDDGTDGETPAAKNHGAEVSAVAHDDSTHGCEHGRAVSSVASGRTKDKPCPSHDAEGTDDDDATPPSTDAESETTTPTANDADHDEHDDHRGNGHHSDHGSGRRGEDHGKHGGRDD